jgi:hypothetical protein
MNTNQVPPSQLRRMCRAEDRSQVDAILAQPGMGAALYQDSSGNRLLMSYGTYKAQLPSRYCPGSVGDMALLAYTPAKGGEADMVSPAMIGAQAQQDTPQFPTRWANEPSRTELPGQRIGIDAVRMVYGLEVPEPQPSRDELLMEREAVALKEAAAAGPKTGLPSRYDRLRPPPRGR